MIEKRTGWDRHEAPMNWNSSLPVEPRKQIRVEIGREYLKEGNTGDLSFLKGCELENVSYEFDGEESIRFVLKQYRYKENKSYEKQHKKYVADLELFNKRNEEYKEELKQWKLWIKQEDEHLLENQIKAAQSFLKKHGKL